MENQYIYLLVCLYFLFAGYYKRVSFVESGHQHSDINGQDLNGLHKMTSLWGGSRCLLSCRSSFRINKQHSLSHCLFSVINSANICIVRYLYSPVHNTDLVKKTPWNKPKKWPQLSSFIQIHIQAWGHVWKCCQHQWLTAYMSQYLVCLHILRKVWNCTHGLAS